MGENPLIREDLVAMKCKLQLLVLMNTWLKFKLTLVSMILPVWVELYVSLTVAKRLKLDIEVSLIISLKLQLVK